MFCAQLDPLPPDFVDSKRKAFQALFPGLTGWLSLAFARSLSDYGMPLDLRDVRAASWAAKLRVHLFENRIGGGLQIRHCMCREEEVRRRSPYLCRLAAWTSWFRTSFVASLDAAMRSAQDRLGPHHSLLRHRVSDAERVACQGALTALLRHPEAEAALTHVRRRLDRWSTPVPPGRRPDRFRDLLASVSSLPPPPHPPGHRCLDAHRL